MAVVTTNLGPVTAYGDAVRGGYTGTKEQWEALMADYGTIGTQAQADAQTASTAAQTATTKASEASASATQAQQAAASVSTPDTTLTQSGKAADAKATGDEISALKSGFNELYNAAFVTDSASGGVAHFVDGADDVPLKSLKVNIVPVQSGSGDPSPSNVRPISGFDTVKVMRAGKNVFPSKGLTQTLNGITIHSNDDGSFTVNGTATANAQFDLTLNNELKLQSGQYTVGMFADKAVTFDNQHIWWFFYNIGAQSDIANCQSPSKTFSLNKITATRFYLRIIRGATVDNVTLYPMLVYGTETPTEFEPYKGTVYGISLSSAGTVYGGTLDVVSGGLNVTHGYIASYSGQTLPSAWISDRDVYAEGTRPTTGAQVVYRLATPLTYQLSATEVKSLLGINNVWSDAGDMDVEYRADTKLYIDKRLGV